MINPAVRDDVVSEAVAGTTRTTTLSSTMTRTAGEWFPASVVDPARILSRSMRDARRAACQPSGVKPPCEGEQASSMASSNLNSCTSLSPAAPCAVENQVAL